VAFKWENNEHGVPIATRDDDGRKPSQTRQNRVANQPQPVVAKPSRTGLLTVFWRALWWSLRACVRLTRTAHRACRKWGVEIVAPVFTLGLYVFSAWLSNRDTFKGLWFSGARVNAGDGERGVVGGGLVWTDLHIAGWWVVPVAILMVGAWAMSAVRQDDQRKSQRFAMLGFVATVPVFAFVVARVGGDRWWLPVRVALAGMTPAAAVVWVLRSPIDDTARGFRRNVRDHRLRRLWQGRVDRAVATLGGAVRVEVTRVRENKLTADVTLRVETLDETTGAAVAARLAELGPSMWPRVRWADNSVTPLAPGSVEAHVDKRDAAKVVMSVRRGDPFAAVVERPDANTATVLDGVRFGVDRRGRAVIVPVVNSSCLIGGKPGSGKSVGMSHVLRVAAEAPDAQLWAVDLKRGVEIAEWRPHAHAVATTPDECLPMLRLLEKTMDDRLDAMAGVSKQWAPSADGPQIVLAVDELAELDEPSFDVLRRIMSLGRAAGISVWAATQRPSADLVPTALRTLFGVAVSFEVRRRSDSDVILGTGWASDGVDASKLSSPGECWIVGAGDGPRHAKAYTASAPPLGKAEPVKGGDQRVRVSLTDNQREVFGLLVSRPMTAAEVASALAMDRGQAGRTLESLVRKGAAVKGSGRPAVFSAADVLVA
jgi:S-DNA-T family DNA segregation ATPase FtsK/SpoIIIE